MSAEPDPSTADDGAVAPVGGPRIEVVRGGRLDARQAAALAVAIAAQAAAGSDQGPGQTEHAWAHAARIEGIGSARIDRPSDLYQAGRPR